MYSQTTTPNIGANVLTLFPTNCENNIHQKVEPSVKHQHLHSLPHNGIPRPHEVSPPISFSEATAMAVILRIHGRLRLEEPLDHGIVALLGCLVQRCVASGAAARGQRKEGEKIRRKFRRLKSRSFGNFGHSKILPWLSEHCGFEDVLMTPSRLKKTMWTRLAVKMLCGNLKKCSISKKTNMRVRLGHNRIWNQSPTERYFV